MPRAFITGSYAYGRPTPDSDIDLVVLVESSAVYQLLLPHADKDSIASASGVLDRDGASLRFGKLNLICEADPVVFEAWRRATTFLVSEREKGAPLPFSREDAARCIDYHLKRLGRGPLAESRAMARERERKARIRAALTCKVCGDPCECEMELPF